MPEVGVEPVGSPFVADAEFVFVAEVEVAPLPSPFKPVSFCDVAESPSSDMVPALIVSDPGGAPSGLKHPTSTKTTAANARRLMHRDLLH